LDVLNGIACEEEIICQFCLSTISWRSYGVYDPDYPKLIFK
jgi:hypothetical protein